MKRSMELSPVSKPLKRANSSLFSIATLVDDDRSPADGFDSGALVIKETRSVSIDSSKLQTSADSALPFLGNGELNDNDDFPPDDGISSSCSSEESDLFCTEIDDDGAAVEAASETLSERQSNKDHRTGLVFESAPNHYDRYSKFHKERPMRITSVYDYLSNSKVEGDGRQTIFERCYLIGNADEAGVSGNASSEELFLDDDDYLRVHLPGYMQRLDKISNCTCNNRLDIEAEQFKSIYFTADSIREAKTAASSLCKLVSEVISEKLDNGFAVIRPPGHHAEPGLAGGYCVINNIAVSAAYARAKLGVEKILIVDWDVHHGNGTQRCFYDDPNVLYFSVHRYHGGNFFPFLQQGGPTSVGNGAGKGFNMNVGWNDKKMGDDEYLVVWEKLLMPVAKEFNPDLVLVSAGFDAASGDMGECDVSPECFGRLTRRLKTLAGGKVVCALEGGYVRSVLCKCIESVLSSLLDANSDEVSKEEMCKFYNNVGEQEMLDCIDYSAAKSIRDTMKAHSEFWKCLKYAK